MNTIMRSFLKNMQRCPAVKRGLKAAGEWHQLKPLFPSLEGKSVLDLGADMAGTASSQKNKELQKY